MAKRHTEEEETGEVLPLTRAVPLNDNERGDRARKLAKAVQALGVLKTDAKAKKKALKAKIDEAEEEIARLAEAVNTGQERVNSQREMFDEAN